MTVDTLLIELGSEELPPKNLKSMGTAFGQLLESALREARFEFSDVKWYASPRRLAVQVHDLTERQRDIEIVKKGPPLKSAYDQDNNPTKAALGWAKSNGIALSDAEIIETPKGKWLQVTLQEKGKNIDSCLEGILESVIKKLPIARMMRWGNELHQFVRPVHNLCCLYGKRIVEIKLLGLQANNSVLGHRFHSPGLHSLHSAQSYSETLKERKVLADYKERRETVLAMLTAQAEQDRAQVVLDDDLLDEVSSLIEWPKLLKAEFEESFLQVPKEALIYTMKDDQKYFPVLNTETGQLLNYFYLITNIESSNPEVIIHGNEKVIRPRLADAQFFFEQDKKTTIQSRLDGLKTIIYQKELGTLHEKSQRIAKLSALLATELNVSTPEKAQRAGEICKSDLTSKMVFEFPDVQGYMGKHYALLEGEDEEVANAINEHYQPRGADDDIPASALSQIVSLADKLVTLVGIFGIGQKPKGDKDPFALRRAALGIIKIALKADYRFDISQALQLALSVYSDISLKNNEVIADVHAFMVNRIENLFIEFGYSVNQIRAVLNSENNVLVDIESKLKALVSYETENAEVVESLVASNKRIANILAKAKSESLPDSVSKELLTEEHEIALFDVFEDLLDDNKENISQRLQQLSKLREPIDNFFTHVMVNAEDEQVRINRIALLSLIRKEFLQIADFSLLQG